MQRRISLAVSLAIAVVLMALTFWLQRYRLCELEESHLFMYHWPWIESTATMVGGVTQLVASFFTQFMLVPWTGPVLTAIIYFAIAYAWCRVGHRLAMPLWGMPIVALPCLLEMMSLGNPNFAYRGIVAFAFASLALWLFSAISRWHTLWGCIICMVTYYVAGGIAIPLAVAIVTTGILTRRSKSLWLMLVIPLVAIEAWLCWRAGSVDSLQHAFSPRLYYENPGTYIMQLYAWAALALFPLAAWSISRIRVSGRGRYVMGAVLTSVLAALVLSMSSVVFHPAIERNMRERYLAKHQRWADILDIDYGATPTEIFSYRTLALAQEGRLTDEIRRINPQFSYFQGRNPYSRKADAQMLSDVFFNCGYLGEARHRAFNANLVTPGSFNPAETQKLVLINIAYGDYDVADKLLAQLDKTLYYSDWAREHRRFLHDDQAVEADALLGSMRRCIPATNSTTSEQATMAHLRRIAEDNSDQHVARQYFEAVSLLLTGVNPATYPALP